MPLNFTCLRYNDIITLSTYEKTIEKYHQNYEKITTFSFLKGIPENLVLCISRNLKKQRIQYNPENSILLMEKKFKLKNVSFLAASNF